MVARTRWRSCAHQQGAAQLRNEGCFGLGMGWDDPETIRKPTPCSRVFLLSAHWWEAGEERVLPAIRAHFNLNSADFSEFAQGFCRRRPQNQVGWWVIPDIR